MSPASSYKGRLAPTPSGYMHIGHARTFTKAYERARAADGGLILRIEDLDAERCAPHYVDAFIEDMHWMGIRWTEGPDVSGPCAPYVQSQRCSLYMDAWQVLNALGLVYPSPQSRRDVERAMAAPHEGEYGHAFPIEMRPGHIEQVEEPGLVNWRMLVPYGSTVSFTDNCAGLCEYLAGRDFGDFMVWSKSGWPSYELAVVVDDHLMNVTEVVRGDDLLISTARQILLYEALGWTPPQFYHCPLVRDKSGERLAKSANGITIRELRDRGLSPKEVLKMADGAV
jgi:glutamyl/glutaminyl-tRNA synthetase